MTNIFIRESYGQKEIYLKGHAGFAPSGSDIVCSAISILTYAFNEVAIELDRRNKLQLNTMKISDGEMHTLVSDMIGSSSTAFFMLRTGLEGLAENYPENVKIFTEWEEFQKSVM